MQDHTFLSIFLLLLLLHQCVFHVLSETCPPKEDMSPCICDSEYSDIEVMCVKPSLVDLQNVFQNLQGKKVKEMLLQELNFERLPSALFRGLHVESLNVDECDLKGISDSDDKPAFLGLENSLEELLISNSIKGENKLKTIDLSHLKRLKNLSLWKNNIPELSNSWFKNGPYSLKDIVLYDNRIVQIGDRAFEKMVNLEYLEISHSSYSTFRRTMLPNPAQKLHSLKLAAANLSNLPEDAFSGMPSLRTVILRSNSITGLPSTTWSSVWEQLNIVDLGTNPLVCDSHIEWTFSLKRPKDLFGSCSPSSPSGREDLILDFLIEMNKG